MLLVVLLRVAGKYSTAWMSDSIPPLHPAGRDSKSFVWHNAELEMRTLKQRMALC